MLTRILFPFLLLFSLCTNAQFKNDNVLYKTVDPSALCTTLAKNNGYLLLDVRSQAEFYDTSSSASYNLGHLKGAINIPVQNLGVRMNEIASQKGKPIFVYCSHSQRSRRALKMLADSGYTHLYNINGGMTFMYYNSLTQNSCLGKMIETSNSYSFISAPELCTKLLQGIPPFILDVRSDSAFRHISRNFKENAYGAFKGTVNIPSDVLAGRLSELPRNRKIIITDIYGDEASEAAVLLTRHGFTDVSVLIEGIDRMMFTEAKKIPCKKSIYQSPVSYKIICTEEFGQFMQSNTNYLLLDIRPAEEFINKSETAWRNIGHLQHAVNIPATVLEKTIEGLGTDKKKTIIIYSFGNSPDIYEVADGLQKEGFSNVVVLVGGIFNIRWTAGNIKGQSYLKDWVVDIPDVNQ